LIRFLLCFITQSHNCSITKKKKKKRIRKNISTSLWLCIKAS
jgi:hypothetical protein